MATVMIISNDSSTVLPLRRLLESVNVHTLLAASAFTACEVINTIAVNLILCDTVVEDGRGIAACMQIRSRLGYRSPPILLMEEEDSAENRMVAFYAGATGTILKSASFETTLRLIQRTCQRYRTAGPSLPPEIAVPDTSERKTDPLTGLMNRNHFNQRLQAEWRYAISSQNPLSLLFLTPDRISDLTTYLGTKAIHQVLSQVALAIAGSMRSRDSVSRFDSHVFAAVFPETGHSKAYTIAADIVQQLSTMQFGNVDTPVRLTLSAGLCSVERPGDIGPDSLIPKVQRRLDIAVKVGGNRVICNDNQCAA